MSTDLCVTATLVSLGKAKNIEGQPEGHRHKDCLTWESQARRSGITAGTSLSAWSRSGTKRIFDCICIVAALPMLIPALLLVALAVWTTSRGPVLFRQKRVGREGRPFTVLKFRSLEDVEATGSTARRFTAIGRRLRRWKLDELPQLLNVLAGDMSLVGPRPKMREYELGNPICRPGITGAATLVFAREEEMLERMQSLRLPDTYRNVVMPAKHRLDTEYMARATFLSDLRLLVRTMLRHWDMATLHAVIGCPDLREPSQRDNAAFAEGRNIASLPGPALPRMVRVATVEAATEI